MAPDDIAISVRNLTKNYRLFGHPGDRIKQFFSLGLKQYHREFTALIDVSFDIKKGETVGIIGGNGSGKSTLLQIICGILKPTAGTVQVNGRVSALLELGAGFNPEFTGRENVYFQGALMGFSQAQMSERFDGIAAFADIGEFIDQPVHIYSSGMFVRLAFAVAVHVAPDVLVVDEALAVGDAAFQGKCYAHIDRIRNTGCTIVFVSHDMGAITTHCDHALLLTKGNLTLSGTSKEVVDRYLIGDTAQPKQDTAFSPASANFDPQLTPLSTNAYVPKGAEIRRVQILTLAGEPANLLRRGQVYLFTYDVDFNIALSNVRCGMLLKTTDGRELGGLTSAPTGEGITTAIGMKHQQRFQFRCNLLPGNYFANAGVVGPEGDYLHRIIDATMFSVLPEPNFGGTGIVDISSVI
jgi:lipopolysaccharide transport system ATP-binding protein